MTPDAGSHLQAALQYASLGMPVHPVHSVIDHTCTCGKASCDKPGKHPWSLRGWKDATLDESRIRTWWESQPTANIGVATGPARLVVIDVDPRNGGEESLKRLVEQLGEDVFATAKAITGGGGLHFFFNDEGQDPLHGGTGKLGPGIDIKAQGGYIVVAPSRHASGKTYSWAPGASPHELPPKPLPEVLRNRLKDSGPHHATPPPSASDAIHAGSRNDRLFRMGVGMARAGMSQAGIGAALRTENALRVQPPLADAEIEAIALSASKYGTKGPITRAGPYLVDRGALAIMKKTRDADIVERLCNFDARIVREEVVDDGNERVSNFVIEGTRDDGSPLGPARVPSAQFASMGWVTKEWGASAIVHAGQAKKDQLRAAIQSLSIDAPKTTIYAHFGWRKVHGKWVYLSGAGALGADGLDAEVKVMPLEGRLGSFRVEPKEGAGLEDPIARSLALLDVAPVGITIPLLAGTVAAVLDEILETDFSLFLTGHTGSQKSSLAAIFQSHWGAPFAYPKAQPTNWNWTANALERAAYTLKDSIMILDDFNPSGTTADIARAHLQADRFLRGRGNRQGRGRLRADASMRAEYYPRALVVVTGEDVPRGHSLVARLLVLPMTLNQVDLQRLTKAQQWAADGLLADSLARFIQWLAPRMDDLRATLPSEVKRLRDTLVGRMPHDRTGEALANLQASLAVLYDYAVDVGALTVPERTTRLGQSWEVLRGLGELQREYLSVEDPAKQFLGLLASALRSGRAHVADIGTDGVPDDGPDLGWRRDSPTNDYPDGLWRPQGKLVGWRKGNELGFDMEVALAEVQNLARQQGTNIPVSKRTLGAQLRQKGHLSAFDASQATVVWSHHEHRIRVLSLHVSTVVGAKPPQQSVIRQPPAGTDITESREGGSP